MTYQNYYIQKGKNVLERTNFINALRIFTCIKKSKSGAQQKSDEWLKQRLSCFTASPCTIFRTGEFFGKTLHEYLEEKRLGKMEQISNPAIDHGVLFEDVASLFFGKLKSVKVHEACQMNHRTHNYLAASVDGFILKYDFTQKTILGESLEIKVPKWRKEIHCVPQKYYDQMQMQMEVLNIDICHFFVTRINKITTKDLFQNKTDTIKGVIFAVPDKNYYFDELLNIDIFDSNVYKKQLSKYIKIHLKNKSYSMISYEITDYFYEVIQKDPNWITEMLPKFEEGARYVGWL